MSKMSANSNKEKTVIIRTVAVTLIIIAFFVGIILVFYSMLYSEKKKNIIKEGESAARQTAERFDKYLSTNIDSIKLSAYTLDGMIRENKSEQEIQDFLVGQSTAIKNAVSENATGLYGYIKGRFYSGTGWIPPAGYDATERPWYIKPMSNKGVIAFLEPYTDLQSGNTMLALGKTLCDDVSVVSVDVSLDQIQQITEESVTSGAADIEMILNQDGIVITHSDINEVGKNYHEETETLGAVIAEKLRSTESDYFEFEYHNAHYIVYSAAIQNEWCCLSVKDATRVFSSLKLILFLTVAVILLIIIIVSVIMANSSKKQLMAEMLNSQLSSTADIYVSMHEINFLTDTFTEVRNNKAEASEMIGEARNHCQQMIFMVMEKFSDPSTRESILDFVDFGKLDERLKNRSTITSEFLSVEHEWRRARYIVSGRLADGRVSRAMYLIEDIDAEKRERDAAVEARDKLTKTAETLNYRISSIANIYTTAHEVDIAADTFTEIKSQLDIVNDLVGESRTNAQKTIMKVMEAVTDDSCIEEVRKFIDLSTLPSRLRKKDTITVEYKNKKRLWRRGRFIASRRTEDGKLSHALFLSEDIDNEKKERDKLIDISERAVAASEAKSSFLSNMSHEIRTPITAVLGMNEMILRECDDRNILAYAASIKTAGSTLLGLVNDILDFSKIEAGKMEIIPVEYDLSSVINDLVNMIKTKADDKGLLLILDLDKNIPKLLKGDEIRIKQVITNILTNAVKYTEKGCITFSMTYEKIPDDPDSVILEIAIKDTGIGIKPEDMKKLFSEFERIDEERNRNVEGTGLGMNITQSLLEMMGTSLKVESIYGLGSKFSFRLKQRVVKWSALGNYEVVYTASLEMHEKYHEKFKAPDAFVLIADDTPMNLTVFRSLLKQTTIKIDTAGSGKECLALAYDKKYDIIFLDHMMPEKDGIETLHEMRSRKNDPNHDTPVICLTANAISGAREKYLSEGFDDYLAKPIDSEKLEDMLLHYLPQEKIQMYVPHLEDTEKKSILPEFLHDISELDIKSVMKNNADEESYLDILKTYANMAQKQISEIENFMASGDIKNAVIKIHALKSSSRIIGANEIGELAQHLENAGKANDTQILENKIGILLERCRTLCEQLSLLVEKKEADNLPPVDTERLKEAFELLKEYAEICDFDSISEIAESLKAYTLPPEEKKRFDAVTEAIENFDYERIPEILS